MGRSSQTAAAREVEPDPDATDNLAGAREEQPSSDDGDVDEDEGDDDEIEAPEPNEFDSTEGSAISLLLQQIGATSLLTREDEQALAHELVAARRAVSAVLSQHTEFIAASCPMPRRGAGLPDDFREREAIAVLEHVVGQIDRDLSDDEAAFVAELRFELARYRRLRDRFLRANLRLVVSLAKRYRRAGVAFADLVQEGIFGLVRAIEKFDPVRDVKFATYAVWWIWQQIGRAGDVQAAVIRTPVHWNQLRRKLGRETVRLEIEQGGTVARALIAEATGIDTERLEAVSQAFFCVSLDAPLDGDERSLADVLASPSPDPEDEQNASDLSEQLEAALARISPRDADILRLRFGTSQRQPMTLEEVGQMLGLSRERVRQIEARALRMLLPICQSQGLRSFID